MISVFDNQRGRPRSDWFDEHAETWVEHGLVTHEQVEAIRAYEHAGAGISPEPAQRRVPGSRWSLNSPSTSAASSR